MNQIPPNDNCSSIENQITSMLDNIINDDTDNHLIFREEEILRPYLMNQQRFYFPKQKKISDTTLLNKTKPSNERKERRFNTICILKRIVSLQRGQSSYFSILYKLVNEHLHMLINHQNG